MFLKIYYVYYIIIMKLITFIFINFIVSFLSDIILNDLSTNFGFITSLKPYFNKESIIKSGIFAAITVEIALFITIIFSYLLFGFLFPTNNKNLLYFCILAFLIGYVIDIIIYKNKIFGNRLDAYYKSLGAGFWGATAFIFSIIISYIIQKNILPFL